MKKEDRAGIYTTVIIHLAVLIVLLATSLGFSLQSENSFVLDFSKLEELERLQAEVERLQQEADFQQAIHDRLERELGAAGASVRNVVVDRSELKDDRGTDADQLYKDAERLARELKGGFELPDDGFTAAAPDNSGKPKEEIVISTKKEVQSQQKTVTSPSTKPEQKIESPKKEEVPVEEKSDKQEKEEKEKIKEKEKEQKEAPK